MNSELIELKNSILADGKIDADEAAQLRDILFADGQIDQEEADFLFELNNAVSGNGNDESWNQLFVEAIAGYFLADENSPNEIDDSEANWLLEKLQGDGQIDQTEQALLKQLAVQATTMPESLKVFIQSNI
jgi:uncharacterized tellurite resistance protein B-like protein